MIKGSVFGVEGEELQAFFLEVIQYIGVIHREAVVVFIEGFILTVLVDWLMTGDHLYQYFTVFLLLFLLVDHVGDQVKTIEELTRCLFLQMHLKDVLVVVVDCLHWLFGLFESLLEREGEQIGLEVELEGVGLDVELAGADLDVWHSDEDFNASFGLFELELRNYHSIMVQLS